MRLRVQFLLAVSSVLFMACEQDSDTPEQVAEFSRTYQMNGHQEAQRLLLDGQGVIVFGTAVSGVQSSFLLMRTDLNGIVLWTRQIAGELNADGHGIARTLDGGYVLIGSHVQGASKDLLLVRTDEAGSVLWQRTFGGVMNDIGRDVIALHDGTFMLIGTTSSQGQGVASVYVLRVDAQGNELWSRTFGGQSLDGGSALVQLDEFQVMLLAFTESFGAGGRDQWLIGVSLEGDSLWSQTIGGPDYEESQGLWRTAGGGYALCTHSGSIDPVHAMNAVRVDGAGNVLWDKHFGNIGLHDGGEGVTEDADGHLWFVGRSTVDSLGEEVYVVCTDAQGNVLSEERFGGMGDQWATDVQSNPTSLFIIANSVEVSTGTSDVLLVKRPL